MSFRYESETIESTWEWAAQLEVFTLNNFLCLLILSTLMDYKENQNENLKTVEWGIFFRKVFKYAACYMQHNAYLSLYNHGIIKKPR